MTTTLLETMVERAGQLYSLPRVAVEVLELTSQPQVDVRRLKETLETDPALTAKVLRVVNSSLYGLSREVADLNQALALLGTKPLKLLTLSFSLPEAMFADLAGDLLERFWLHTLTRAVAAREISQTLCRVPGDDAFITGLLRDLGQLVLVRELGKTYVELWRSVAAGNGPLSALERHALGFDHTQLTARLLDHWRMPSAIVAVVAASESLLARRPLPVRTRELRHIVHLAELTAQLLADRSLEVLPELAEGFRSWLQIGQEGLSAFLATLQDKVAELAELMSIQTPAVEHSEILRQAHARLAEVALDAATELVRRSMEASPEALESPTVWALCQTVANYARWQVGGDKGSVSAAPAEAEESNVRASPGRTGDRPMRKPPPASAKAKREDRVKGTSARGRAADEQRPPALSPRSSAAPRGVDSPRSAVPAVAPAPQSSSSPAKGTAPSPQPPESPPRKVFPGKKPDRPPRKPAKSPPAPEEWPGLEALVAAALPACRAARVPLSLMCLELTGHAELVFALGAQHAGEILQFVEQACGGIEHPDVKCLRTHETRFGLILPGCGRQQAVQIGDDLIEVLRRGIGRRVGSRSAAATLSAGIATLSLPPKNFPAQELIDRASRCLYAARAAGGDCLKSIEIL